MVSTASKITLCYLIHISILDLCFAVADEKRLLDHLQNSYSNKHVRPVANATDTASVFVGLSLLDLQLDEANELLALNSWLRLRWTDYYLRWNPDDFGGLSQTRLPVDKIWTPDITLYNAARPELGISFSNRVLAVVQHSGEVILIQPVHLSVKCSIDPTFFPFDMQMCILKLGSWTHDGTKLDLDFFNSLEAVDLTNYLSNNQFDIIDKSGVKSVKYYPCCQEPYLDITFNLNFIRVPSLERLAYVVPAVLLSVMTTLVFLFPAASDSRKVYIAYLAALLLLNVLAVFLSCMIACLNAYGEGGARMPSLLKTIISPIVRCVQRTCDESESSAVMFKNSQERDDDEARLVVRQNSGEYQSDSQIASVQEVEVLLRKLLGKLDASRRRCISSREWNILVSIIDLSLFFIYIVIICVIGGYFLWSPYK